MELTEILEAREAKLVELSRTNVELQDKNLVLRKQVEVSKIASIVTMWSLHGKETKFLCFHYAGDQ